MMPTTEKGRPSTHTNISTPTQNCAGIYCAYCVFVVLFGRFTQ